MRLLGGGKAVWALTGLMLTAFWVTVNAGEPEDKDSKTVLEQIQKSDQIEILQFEEELTDSQLEGIQEAIERFQEKGQQVSFVMEDLESGACVYYQAKEDYFCASTIKAPYVVQVVENYVDTGEAPLNDTKFYRADYARIGGTGTIQNDPPDTEYNLRQVITATIQESDNMGYEMLYEKFGTEGVKQWYQEHALANMPEISQYVMFNGQEFAKMWMGIAEYFQSDGSHISWLKSRFKNSAGSVLQAELGQEYTVYSKPGYMVSSQEDYNVFHDGGLVDDGENPYLLVVLSDGVGWDEASASQDSPEVQENRENLRNLVRKLDTLHSEMRKAVQDNDSIGQVMEIQEEESKDREIPEDFQESTEELEDQQGEPEEIQEEDGDLQESDESDSETSEIVTDLRPGEPSKGTIIGPPMPTATPSPTPTPTPLPSPTPTPKPEKLPEETLREVVNEMAAGEGIQKLGTAYEPSALRLEKLQHAMDAIEEQGQKLSFAMVDMNTGAAYYYQPDQVLFSASTIKGPYIASLMEELIGPREMSLKETMFRRGDYGASGGTGIMKLDSGDTTYMLGEMLAKTIRYSDDLGYSMLRDHFGAESFRQWLSKAGVESSYADYSYPMFTVKELAKMWLHMDTYFGTEDPYAQWLKTKYTQSESSTIRMELEEEYRIYSKPGFNEGPQGDHLYDAFDDAGIVDDGDNPYILVIMTDGKGWDNATESADTQEVQSNTRRLKALVRQLNLLHEDFVEKGAAES